MSNGHCCQVFRSVNRLREPTLFGGQLHAQHEMDEARGGETFYSVVCLFHAVNVSRDIRSSKSHIWPLQVPEKLQPRLECP